MRNPVWLVVLLASLPMLSGCLKAQLRAPVEDHRVQTSTIAELCKTDGYAESPCSQNLQEDLDAMAEQAELLDKIIKGQKPGGEDE